MGTAVNIIDVDKRLPLALLFKCGVYNLFSVLAFKSEWVSFSFQIISNFKEKNNAGNNSTVKCFSSFVPGDILQDLQYVSAQSFLCYKLDVCLFPYIQRTIMKDNIENVSRTMWGLLLYDHLVSS